MFETLNNFIFVNPLYLQILYSCLIALCFCLFEKFVSKNDILTTAFLFVIVVAIVMGLRLEGFLVFISYFVASHLLERKLKRKSWDYVFSNFFIAAIASLIYLKGNSIGLIVFCTCIAESTSDFWATIFGLRSKKQPFLLMSLRKTDKGTSGGATTLGFIGAFLGSLFITFLSELLFAFDALTFGLILICSFSGCLFDTILGSTIQALYFDDETKRNNEEGQGNLVRGIRWVSGSVVDLMSNSLSGALIITLISLI